MKQEAEREFTIEEQIGFELDNLRITAKSCRGKNAEKRLSETITLPAQTMTGLEFLAGSIEDTINEISGLVSKLGKRAVAGGKRFLRGARAGAVQRKDRMGSRSRDPEEIPERGGWPESLGPPLQPRPVPSQHDSAGEDLQAGGRSGPAKVTSRHSNPRGQGLNLPFLFWLVIWFDEATGSNGNIITISCEEFYHIVYEISFQAPFGIGADPIL